jgi:hypothetical protein
MKTKRVVAVEEERNGKKKKRGQRKRKRKETKQRAFQNFKKLFTKIFTEREAFHSSTLSLSL